MTAHDPAAVRDVLQGLQDAFAQAKAQRLDAVRRLGRLRPSGGDDTARRVLAEAVLRREAADGGDRPLSQRLAVVAAEAGRARAARRDLSGDAPALALADEIDATWTDALATGDRLAAGLQGRADPPLAAAFGAYVAALRALHELDPGAGAATVGAAVDGYHAALATLERAAGL
ncbi:hypothetical protein FSW04_18210 [Baekduia soli]|uniref:Uncharacterized protein n=1 Tax=Baekduia soli TaxID=496014 RepID=A0A5B8U8R8_9ACTN|nr:hypothetical protein [Baekduia soli]QEC49321.1 hypothetical protein FSW04_18210 [Baekduia soli]